MDESSLISVADNLGVLQLIIEERGLPIELRHPIDRIISKLMELSRFYNKHYGNKTLEVGAAAAVEAQLIISYFIRKEEQKGFLNKAIFFLNDLITRKKNAWRKLESINQVNQVIDRVFEVACSSTTTISNADDSTTTGGESHDEDILFVGREDDIRFIQYYLISNVVSCFRMISIVGMTGVGKTCLARKIYNSQQSRTHFDCLAWICAREHFPTVELLKAIAKQMGYSSEAERFPVHGFFDFLERKRCLIVIDGVLTCEAWLHYLGHNTSPSPALEQGE